MSMTDREILETLLTRFDKVDDRLDRIEVRLDKMEVRLDKLEEDMEDVKENTAVTRGVTNALGEWAETVSVITQVKFPFAKAE